MKFFKKIFKSNKVDDPLKNPENTRLIFLLNNFRENSSAANYELVVKELSQGNSFLILPTINSGQNEDWRVANGDTKLKLTSVFDLDGLKVLGAFSDEKSLLAWAKKPCPYTALKSQAVLDICKDINVGRIVINSGSSNIFVAERKNETEQINVKEGTTIRIGSPAKPLNERLIKNLISNFQVIENVLEAYQFMKAINNEPCIAIGLKLLSYSDNAKKAVLDAVQTALQKEPNQTFVDTIFLETDNWYNMVKDVQHALFYKKAR